MMIHTRGLLFSLSPFFIIFILDPNLLAALTSCYCINHHSGTRPLGTKWLEMVCTHWHTALALVLCHHRLLELVKPLLCQSKRKTFSFFLTISIPFLLFSICQVSISTMPTWLWSLWHSNSPCLSSNHLQFNFFSFLVSCLFFENWVEWQRSVGFTV